MTQNPYEAVDVDAPEVRTLAVPFAVSAAVAFEVSAIAFTGNDFSVYFGTPIAVLGNVVPVFVFALLVGRFNVIPKSARRIWGALSGRLLGGCLLGVSAVPVNHAILGYLYLLPLPSKLSEVWLCLLLPVVLCTMAERVFLRVLEQNDRVDETKAGPV
ncbi:hypothetical protein [Stieleria mannarensis]|uniref:hypothetical protein n=1 Tax=Stieleria mannarensis TaxID=2755585 RepID=UPI0015FEDD1D|nr:hypothetical protein [Rhodopirellula sp. JC639]